MNKLHKKDEFKKSYLIGNFYRKYTPLIHGCYDQRHKNYNIAEGAYYGGAICTYEGYDKLVEVYKHKDISLCELRQDKIINKYFWIGMHLALNAEGLNE